MRECELVTAESLADSSAGTCANQISLFASYSTSWQPSASAGTIVRCRLVERGVEIERAGKQPAGLGQQRGAAHRLFGHLAGRLLAGQLHAMGRLLANRLRFLIEIDEHPTLVRSTSGSIGVEMKSTAPSE